MRIVVDAMGGDFAPQAPVEGSLLARRELGCEMLLVGRRAEIEPELARRDRHGPGPRVVDAAEVIGMDELAPAAAVKARPDNSISRGMTLVRQGEAAGFVTMGHTGAALAGATYRLGRIHGVRRAALATPFPTLKGPCLLVDIGANSEVKAENLLQFGVMGAAYVERVFGIARPRVGLVSNGEERGKGSPVVQEALPLLEASPLHFLGNIEGHDIPMGNVDVAVMDGFTGNVMVKFAEGAAALIGHILRQSADGDPLALVGGLLMRRTLGRARERMDYRSFGGAVLLGVRGVVIIGHGRSDATAVKTAVAVAVRAVDHGLVQAIESGVAAAMPAAPAAREA